VLIKNIRRGNTYLEIYDKNDRFLLKDTIVGRKGLMKFYDLQPEYMLDDETFRSEHNFLTRNSKRASEDHMNANIRNYIMGNVVSSLDQGAYIEVVKTLKVNGENAQVSWVDSEGIWCIASKNVGILAKSSDDLKKYKTSGNQRYQYAVEIAYAWFKVLNSLKNKKVPLAKLQKAMDGKTFVGEFVGKRENQHMIGYSKETIVFYSIVDNKSTDENCLLPEESYKIFNEFKLDCVPVDRVGVYDNIDSLSEALNHEYNVVSSASMNEEEEGSVLYMIKRGLDDDKVLSLSKLKTLEYRIFRKLREKLRNFWHKQNFKKPFDNRVQSFYDGAYQKWLYETKELVKGHHLPQPISFYQEIANYAFVA